MKIDFSAFKAPDGFPVEALQNQEFLTFIEEAGKGQISVATTVIKEDLEKMTRNKVISDQKAEDMQKKLDDALKDPGTKDEQVKKLETELASAKEDAKAEYVPQIDALNEKMKAAEQKNQELESQHEGTLKRAFVTEGISKYNAQTDTRKIKSGDHLDFLIEGAMALYEKTEDGTFRAKGSDGQLIPGAKGLANQVEVISHLRDDPKYQLFFDQPTGGGAGGGNGGGADDKSMTRSQFDAITDTSKKAEVAKTHKITEG